MNRLGCMLGLVPLLAVTTSCRRAAETGGGTREGALDFETGTVQGTISWNGTAISQADAYNLYLFEPGSAVSAYSNDPTYQLQGVPTGTHTVGLYVTSCFDDPYAKIGETTFSLATGATITADFDLTATAGRVTGAAHVNGAATSGLRFQIDKPGCAQSTFADDQGAFSRILAPGAYQAEVFNATGMLESVSFTIVAGQTTDLGTIDITGGSVHGTVLWNGNPIDALEALDLYLYEPGSVSLLLSQASYQLSGIVPGTHLVGLYTTTCTSDPSSKLGEVTFTAVTGSDVTADIELTATAGRLSGSILSGGAPLSSARLEIGDSGCTSGVFGDATGHFSRPLAPGTYSASVFSQAGLVDSFQFTIVAGQTTDLGTIDIPTGDVQGTILWKGNPLNAVEAQNLYLFEPGGVSAWTSTATYELDGVLPGAHTVGLFNNGCTSDPVKLGERSFVVDPGSTTTADFDLTSTAGQLTGSIRANGAPLPNAQVQLRASQALCAFNTAVDGAGNFSRIMNPGTYTARVLGPSGIVGSFNFAIVVGQTTNVDNFTTPAGTNVVTNLAGGLAAVGGLLLDFSSVLTPGNTTIVQSGIGPPVPPGYQVVGFLGQPMFWDITTTAAYAGPITVCIHYDPTDVKGNESMLQLEHDDGTGFKTVRGMALDLVTHTVCGDTDSLSPFVIVEPIVGANTPPIVTVPPNLSLEATGPDGAVATFVASASDTEDGAPTTSCTPASGSTFPVGTTPVTCTATDSGGLSASASFTVTVSDTTGPAFAAFPDPIVAYATSRSGAVVTYASPTATDLVSGPSSVGCTPASGSKFPLGKSAVHCTAVDGNGNSSPASFTIWVQVQAPTDGTFFLAPLAPDGSSIFKKGSTVPVRFRLRGASGGIIDLTAHLLVASVSSGVTGPFVAATSASAGDAGNAFRFDPSCGQYVFNLSTRSLGTGTWSLRADLGDGVTHQNNISLR
jgi:HYR domain